MQTFGGPEADTAITAPERTIRAEIKVDWNRDGNYSHALSDLSPYVDNITVDRALSGAAPQEIMLVEGAAAAELSFDVGGFIPPGTYGTLTLTNFMNLVSVFSPYNGISPMYTFDMVGCEITYRLGVDTSIGTIWYPQFIGNIRTITPTRGDNKIGFTALDRVEKLRKPITITDWGILDYQANQGYILSQLMNGHWVMDHCLKSCNISASPYRWPFNEELRDATHPKALTQLYVSGNGGIAPNIGWVDGSGQNVFPNTEDDSTKTMYHDRGRAHPSSPEPTNRPQMFKSQQNFGGDRTVYWCMDKDRVLDGACHQITFTLHTETYAGSEWFATMPDTMILAVDVKDSRQLQVWIGGGTVFLRYVDDSFGGVWTTTRITIPTGVGNEYVDCTAYLEYGSSGERMKLRASGLSTAMVTMQAVRGWIQTSLIGRFQLWREIAIQDLVYVTFDYFTSNLQANVPAKYAAVLDRSLNRLSFLPKRWGALAWDVIAEVAAAEFGAVLWDETGYFHFWNQDTILAKKSNFVRTFSLDEVSGLEITTSTDSIRNTFSIGVKKSRVQSVRVFEAQGPDELLLAPGVFTEFRVWVDDIVTPNSAQPPTYENPDSTGPLPKWTDPVNFGLVAQHLVAGVWTDFLPSSPWQGFMYRKPDGSTMVRLWNGYGEYVRFSDTNGGAAFRWDGSKLTSFDDQVFALSDAASVAKWGQQGLELSGDWYQEFFSYGTFFTKLLARTTKPIPTTQNITVSGDPRIQLGDAVKVYDPLGLGENMQFQILGISRSYTRDSGLVDSYTVEMTEPPRIGIWDSAQYGVWDASFIWSA